MKRTLYTFFVSVLVSTFNPIHAQYDNKDIIYLVFQENDGSAPYNRGKKFYYEREKGTVFNHLVRGSFLFKDGMKSDTLDLSELHKFKITKAEEIDKLVANWRERNHDDLVSYYGDNYPPFDKNGMFETYIIEIFDEDGCIVVYPVSWRGENTTR